MGPPKDSCVVRDTKSGTWRARATWRLPKVECNPAREDVAMGFAKAVEAAVAADLMRLAAHGTMDSTSQNTNALPVNGAAATAADASRLQVDSALREG